MKLGETLNSCRIMLNAEKEDTGATVDQQRQPYIDCHAEVRRMRTEKTG